MYISRWRAMKVIETEDVSQASDEEQVERHDEELP